MTRLWRVILRILAVLVAIASIVWLIVQPGFEPLIGFLTAISAVIASVVGEERDTDKRSSTETPDDSQSNPSELLAPRPRIVNLRPRDVAHSFKNREDEISAFLRYLSEDGVRLITVVGRAGMGKTAFACRVLADLEQGILRVPERDTELVIGGILYLSARSTGLSLDRIYVDVARMLDETAAGWLKARWENPEMSLVAKVEHLLEAMQGDLYVILLDNFEDVLAEDHTISEEGLRIFVESCLTQPTRARLIVTSREQVNVAGTALHNVRSILLLDGLPEQDSVSLLRELDPQGMLNLRDATTAELQRAVQSTSGIPRAIEMVAGILHRDQTTTLKELLENQALFGEHVVEKLVAEGYQRLSDDERRVMEALAVFDAPVSEKAISDLLAPWFPNVSVRDCLRNLASSYFVIALRKTAEYSLHPLDRDYAYRQLPSDGVDTVYCQRSLELGAADFYASLRKPEQEWRSLEDVAPQLAEFEHRTRAEDYDGACIIVESIGERLSQWGHYARVLYIREKLLGHLGDPRLQAANLRELAGTYQNLGQLGQAISFLNQALGIDQEIGYREGEGKDLNLLGGVYQDAGQIDRAIEFNERSLAVHRESGYRMGEATALTDLGYAYRDLGEIERAIGLFEHALKISQEIGDRQSEGTDLTYLGRAYYDLGQMEQAIEFYQRALEIDREIGYRQGEGADLTDLGSAYQDLGQVQQAIALYEQALKIDREIGYRRGEAVDLNVLARAYHDLGQIERAIDSYEQALEIHRGIGHRQGEGGDLDSLGLAYRDLGQFDQAIEFHRRALGVFREIGYVQGECMALDHTGNAHYAVGQLHQAVDCHSQALDIAIQIDHRLQQSHALINLGTALLAADEVALAVSRCREALALDMPPTSYRAASVCGIALLRQRDPAVEQMITEAIEFCRSLLDKTPNLFRPRYSLAAALIVRAVSGPDWTKLEKRTELLAPAWGQYRRALDNCSAQGVVQDALRDLELIRAAGIEGLEPVFELLEGAIKEA